MNLIIMNSNNSNYMFSETGVPKSVREWLNEPLSPLFVIVKYFITFGKNIMHIIVISPLLVRRWDSYSLYKLQFTHFQTIHHLPDPGGSAYSLSFCSTSFSRPARTDDRIWILETRFFLTSSNSGSRFSTAAGSWMSWNKWPSAPPSSMAELAP